MRLSHIYRMFNSSKYSKLCVGQD